LEVIITRISHNIVSAQLCIACLQLAYMFVCFIEKKRGKIVNFSVRFIVTKGEVIIVFDMQCLMYEWWPENEFMCHIIVSPKNLHRFIFYEGNVLQSSCL
jgi:hypothetical protein